LKEKFHNIQNENRPKSSTLIKKQRLKIESLEQENQVLKDQTESLTKKKTKDKKGSKQKDIEEKQSEIAKTTDDDELISNENKQLKLKLVELMKENDESRQLFHDCNKKKSSFEKELEETKYDQHFSKGKFFI
jgi:chromosome segregation ATPase